MSRGLEEGLHFATLTDIIYKTRADKTAKEYKQYKGLKKENLRDNMTNAELVLNMLAELSTKQISETSNPESMDEHAQAAKQGGEIARNARKEINGNNHRFKGRRTEKKSYFCTNLKCLFYPD